MVKVLIACRGAWGGELGTRAALGAVKGVLVSIYQYETIIHSNLLAEM